MPAPRRQAGWSSIRPVRTAIALAVVSCAVAASFLAGWQVKNTAEKEARTKFAGVCDEITTRIRERLAAHAVMLQGSQALMNASQLVERSEWRAYFETMVNEQNVRGYQAAGFAKLETAGSLPRLVAAVRSEGFPVYEVTPAGERDAYAPVVFIEPFAGRNLRAFGFDMLSEPVRREAMDQARDTGKAALTGKVRLVQEDTRDTQAGALIYLPVYGKGLPVTTSEERRAAITGWIFGTYRMDDLMSEIVPDWSLLGKRFLDLHIYDGAAAAPDKLVFDSKKNGNEEKTRSFLHEERMVDFNGHNWLLVFNGREAVRDIDYLPAWITTGAGLIISGLIFGVMLVSYKRADAQRTAESYAEEIRGMAFHDSLTKLPNRLLLRDRLDMALAGAKRSGRPGALLMVDLDNFKPLNDTRGHAAGDLLLVEVARRIRGCVRKTDTVARIGGDEFVVLLVSLTGGEDAARREAGAVADKLLGALSLPYHLEPETAGEEHIEHRCSSSIGIALFSGEEHDQSGIIKRADAAMYAAKRSGRNRAHFDMVENKAARETGSVLQQV